MGARGYYITAREVVLAREKTMSGKGDSRAYPGRPIVGVGGVVIMEGKTLLVERGSPPLEGTWSIPGGSLETGESLEEGVRREMLEETGLDVHVGELLEVFDRVFRDPDGRVRYHFVILDYLCERVGGEALAGSDVTALAWTGEDGLAEYSLTPIATRVIRKAFARRRGED
jgi:8-oxo-dGTP diphosphatase